MPKVSFPTDGRGALPQEEMDADPGGAVLRENNIIVRDFADFNPKPSPRRTRAFPLQPLPGSAPSPSSRPMPGPRPRQVVRPCQLPRSRPTRNITQTRMAPNQGNMARMAAEHAATKYEKEKSKGDKQPEVRKDAVDMAKIPPW